MRIRYKQDYNGEYKVIKKGTEADVTKEKGSELLSIGAVELVDVVSIEELKQVFKKQKRKK